MNEDVDVDVALTAATKRCHLHHLLPILHRHLKNEVEEGHVDQERKSRTAAKDSRKVVNVDEDADVDPKDNLSDSIILLIPQCLMENASKRRSVLKSATFQEVTQLVHEAMDCEDAQLKPTSDTDAVTEAFVKLKAARSRCAVCGPTKPCLVEVHTPMVTLSRPPHTEAFEVFFKKQNQPTPQDPIVIAPPVSPMPAVPAPGTTWPFYPSLPGYPPGYPVYPQHMSPMPYAYSHSPFPAVPAPAPVPAPTAISEPSSDPPKAGTPSTYPECSVFMKVLADAHPKCNLHAFVSAFEDTGFFHIDELKNFKVAGLTVAPYSLLLGTAQFILMAVTKKVASINRTCKGKAKAT
ncbi:hypothetical protein JB92DRAFT_2826776 [Gautieria morchelliformis]|nr:hypothetical protein JB92DRAFT_2826776 [Gautieria morchelliformis]